MKRILSIIFSVVVFSLIPLSISYAYTEAEVAKHSSVNDCWVVFDSGVYDITKYISLHDSNYLDIRSWCGKDITKDFQSKGGTGQNHKSSSYTLLERYKIGSLDSTTQSVTQTVPLPPELVQEGTVIKQSSEYNLIVPLLFSAFTYWFSYLLVKKNKFFGVNIIRFNGFWNSILFLTLLIPSFGFGVFMILRTQYSSLWNSSFNFMYWHVELSLVMGMLGINHFIQRFVIYRKQIGR